MATTATTLKVAELGPRQLSALKRKAEGLGLTPANYVKQLIEEDLARDRKARNTSLDELAVPYRKALKDVGEKELDELVDAARSRHHARTSNHRR